LWSIFFIAFLSGFAALLTLCVPNDSYDSEFFTKQSKLKPKNSKCYYLWHCNYFYLCGVGIFSDLDFGADALNALSTNVWFNIIFFIPCCICFVILGAFEIMLPNSWANKVDNQADRGGIIGILFMALAL
jgi:thiol:disulfide interchange protein DsbD